jgi:hypothetical protein
MSFVKVRISLSEQDFRKLVAGKIVEPQEFRMVRTLDNGTSIGEVGVVEVALQDIGWERMSMAILDAEHDQRHGKV